MPDSQQRKQSACDRCRAQKLKCHRTENHSCSRCIRCGLECTSSSSRRPGRPLKYKDGALDIPPNASSNTFNATSSAIELGGVPDELHVGDGFSFDPDEIDFDLDESYWSSMGEQVGPTSSTSVDSTSFRQSPNAMREFSDMLATAPIPFPTTHSQSDLAFIGHGAERQSDKVDLPGLRISELYQALSQQLSALKSRPWDVRKVLMVASVQDGRPDASATSDIIYNPLANVVRSSAHFAELLREFLISEPAYPESSKVGSFGVPSVTYSQLGTADYLSITSCHFIVISIYDSILSQCLAEIFEEQTPLKPSVSLGGISVPLKPSIMCQLLFSVMDNQLQAIEELLGLPSEFCVSWDRGPSSAKDQTGLLWDRRGQSLFQSLMQLEMGRERGEKDGLGAIETLKSKRKTYAARSS